MRARGAAAGARVIDEVLQLFAGLEEGNLLGRHFHFGAGLRIAPGAAAALARAEAAEAADFDLVAGLQRADDAFENVSTTASDSFRGSSVTRITSSTRSAFVTV